MRTVSVRALPDAHPGGQVQVARDIAAEYMGQTKFRQLDTLELHLHHLANCS